MPESLVAFVDAVAATAQTRLVRTVDRNVTRRATKGRDTRQTDYCGRPASTQRALQAALTRAQQLLLILLTVTLREFPSPSFPSPLSSLPFPLEVGPLPFPPSP